MSKHIREDKHIAIKNSKPKFQINDLTLILIVAFLAIIVSIYEKNFGTRGSEPQVPEAEKITGMILGPQGISLATNGIIDENKLRMLQNMNYDELKKSVNAQNDFCIYVKDGFGNVILAKGAPKLNKDGLCGG